MPEPTKADLKAAVAKLTTELAAHRELLAAICELATVPKAADWTSVPYICAIEDRLMTLAVYARSLDDVSPNIMVGVIRDRAKSLREDAAKPVRYESAPPAPSGIQDTAPVVRVLDVKAPAPEGNWCPATTMRDGITVYCDREDAHDEHRAPGPDEGSEVAWSDEPATAAAR